MSMMRRAFGPSREEIWRQLSEAVDSCYAAGRFASSDRVEVDYGEWTLTLDIYTVSTSTTTAGFTRMRAPFVNPDGFRFNIYRKSVFSGLGKLFGMQDIAIGDPPFDDDFIIQATDEAGIRSLLASTSIRDLLSKQMDVRFSVQDDEGWFGTKFPDGVDELLYAVPGVIKDIERLRLLYDLFAETLDELCRIGRAADTPPGIEVN
jgi:hypothetical protein